MHPPFRNLPGHPSAASVFAGGCRFPFVVGRIVCWECGQSPNPVAAGLAQPSNIGRFCSYECRVVFFERRYREIGYPGCPACHLVGRHLDPCRWYVGVRDGWQCRLCHQPVEWWRRNPDPLMATIDHILPASQGGRRINANLRLAHRICNTLRDQHDDETWFELTGLQPAE